MSCGVFEDVWGVLFWSFWGPFWVLGGRFGARNGPLEASRGELVRHGPSGDVLERFRENSGVAPGPVQEGSGRRLGGLGGVLGRPRGASGAFLRRSEATSEAFVLELPIFVVLKCGR